MMEGDAAKAREETMVDGPKFAVNLSDDAAVQLQKLAAATNADEGALIHARVEAAIAEELAIVEGIQRGLADVEAGHVFDHDDVMSELAAHIADVAAARPS